MIFCAAAIIGVGMLAYTACGLYHLGKAMEGY